MSTDRGVVRLRRGVVTAVRAERPGALELDVRVEGRDAPAIAYPELTGPIEVGSNVLLNTTSVALGLGTGGVHLVVAVVDETANEPRTPAGRVMKARYTPLQVAVSALEETHRDAIERARGLGGLPVVCAPLHSMVAPVAAGARAAGAERVVYVMTDGAALAGGFSRLVPRLLDAGLLETWISVGQAFGGEHEATTLWTGLLASAAVLGADVAIVADGPGNLGTETRWGVSALASGHALDAADTLGGRPVAALRISFADNRDRHRVVSHHSLTILEHVSHARANVAVPVLEDDRRRNAVWDALRSAKAADRHHLVEVDGRPALAKLEEVGVEVRSMGRSPTDDPAFFLAAGAAGVLAGRMTAGSRRWRGSDPSE
jgi:Protein of unknown function (DUF3866)